MPKGNDASALLFANAVKPGKTKQVGHATVDERTEARKRRVVEATRIAMQKLAKRREAAEVEATLLHPRAELFEQCKHDSHARWRAEQLFGYAWRDQRKVAQA